MNNCSNCGAQLAPNVKFCTKCGNPVVQAASVASQAQNYVASNQTITVLKSRSSNYFAWIKQTIMDPTNDKTDTKFFGLISFFVHALLVAFALYRVNNAIAEPIAKATHSSGLADVVSEMANFHVLTGFQLYAKILFFAVIYYAIFLGIGFFSKKLFLDKQADFFNYSNQLARFSNIILPLELLFAVAMFLTMPADITAGNPMNAFSLMGIILVVSGAAWSAAFVSSIIMEKAQLKLNKIYVGMIALVASNVVILFLIKITILDFVNKYATMFQKLLGSIFSGLS